MDHRESIRNQTAVGLSLAKRLLSNEFKDENAVFSPLSIHVALSVIAAGSDGSTLNELLTFLRCKSTDELDSLASHLNSYVLSDAAPPLLDDGRECRPSFTESESESESEVENEDDDCSPYFTESEGPDVRFVNGAWLDQSFPFSHSYKQLLATNYKATLDSVDFINKADEVHKEVNLWAEEKTNGLVKNLIPPGSVHNLTRLIFANALYFKASWEVGFDASMTKEHDFHLLNDTSLKVPFMISKADRFIRVFDGFKVLSLPYESGQDERLFAMYIFLPDANDGVSALLEQMTSTSEFIDNHLPRSRVEVGDFKIPKFKFSLGLAISKLLQEMGLVLPFSKADADLSKMVEPLMSHRKLYVSNIRHKSIIVVDEEGTEAVAVAEESDDDYYLDDEYEEKEKIDFVADHPFIFLIKERLTGTILFFGHVLNPLDESESSVHAEE